MFIFILVIVWVKLVFFYNNWLLFRQQIRINFIVIERMAKLYLSGNRLRVWLRLLSLGIKHPVSLLFWLYIWWNFTCSFKHLLFKSFWEGHLRLIEIQVSDIDQGFSLSKRCFILSLGLRDILRRGALLCWLWLVFDLYGHIIHLLLSEFGLEHWQIILMIKFLFFNFWAIFEVSHELCVLFWDTFLGKRPSSSIMSTSLA
jgi:hypothetical protein